MPNRRTLTAANAILTLSIEGLYDVPQRIQGFSADNVTSMEAVQNMESSMGVDGRLSAGWAPTPKQQSIVLQADSLSNDLFENWAQAEEQVREKYVATGQLILKATGRKYAMIRGFLMSYTPIPSAARTLQPRTYSIQWESVQPSPTSVGAPLIPGFTGL